MKVPSLRHGPSQSWTQMLRFGYSGIANSAVGFGVFLFAHGLVGINPNASNALAYAFGLAVAAISFRKWVFPSRRKLKSYLFRFFVAFLLAFALNQAVLSVCVGVFFLPAVLGQVISMATYSLVFFLLSRALLASR